MSDEKLEGLRGEESQHPDSILSFIPPDKLQDVYDAAQQIMQKDKPAALSCQMMIHGLQLFHAGRQNLQGRLEELKRNPRDGVEIHLTRSMHQKAMEGFEVADLLANMQKKALPWMASLISAEQLQVNKQQAARLESYHKSRLEREVPVGFRWSEAQMDQPYTLARKEPLVVVGNCKAAQFLADKVAETIRKTLVVDEYRPQVLRLTTKHSVPLIDKRENLAYLELPFGKWAGKLTSRTAITKTLGRAIRQMTNVQVDMLLIDDLSAIVSLTRDTFGHRPVGAAMRHVSRWAEEVGCAVFGALPLDHVKEAPDLSDAVEWGRLREWATVKAISLVEGKYDEDYECETYNLLLDGLAAVEGADRAIFDPFGKNE